MEKITVLQKLDEMLQNNGLGEVATSKIIPLAIIDAEADMLEIHNKENESIPEDERPQQYKITWNSDHREYPEGLIKFWFKKYVRPATYKWGLENYPLAWWLPDFAPKETSNQ